MKGIMKRAWQIAKEAVVKFGGKVKEYFAQSLKMAWAEQKNRGMHVYIKDWFLNKVDIPYYAIPQAEVMIIRESEKAYFVCMDTETTDGETDLSLKIWVPKKCTQTLEEREAEKAAYRKKEEEAELRYNQLVAFCKSNNVKGARSGLRVATLLRKVAEAGLNYAY